MFKSCESEPDMTELFVLSAHDAMGAKRCLGHGG